MHHVQHTASSAYFKHSIHWVHHSPNTTYTQYSLHPVHPVQHAPSMVFTEFSIFQVQHPPKNICLPRFVMLMIWPQNIDSASSMLPFTLTATSELSMWAQSPIQLVTFPEWWVKYLMTRVIAPRMPLDQLRLDWLCPDELPRDKQPPVKPPPSALHCHLIIPSKWVSNITQSQPSRETVSSLHFSLWLEEYFAFTHLQSPSVSQCSLNHSFHMHFHAGLITASKYISMISWSETSGAPPIARMHLL